MAIEERYPSGNGGNSMFAFLSGVFVGATAGLLFAPESGSRTRERLRGYARQAKEQAEDVAGQAAEQAKDAASRVAERGRQMAERGREYVQERAGSITGAISDAAKAGREAAQGERERLGGRQS